MIWGTSNGLLADDFDAAYQAGIAAKKEGRHEEAIAHLQKALALQPQHLEAMTQLGAVLGWTKRYDEATGIYARALALAPKDVELRMGAARVKAWKGDFDDARRDFMAILEDDPAQLDARVMLARLSAWRKKYDEAEAEYHRILAVASEGAEPRLQSLIGLGDLRVWQEQPNQAREYYRQAQAMMPQSPEIREKLRQVEELSLWRVDTGYSYSTFSGQSRSDWHEGYTQIGYAITGKTRASLRYENDHRFDLSDEWIEGGVEQRFLDPFNAYARFGGAPDADFLPEWKTATGGTFRFWNGEKILGPSLLTFDYRHARYREGAADSFAPGFEQYVTRRFSVSARWLRTINLSGETTDGWLARANWLPWDDITLQAGMAESKESLAPTAFTLSRKIPAHAWFAGVLWDISRRTSVRADYTREELEKSYTRNSIHLGLTVRF